MAKIVITDTLFVTLSHCPRIFMRARLSGIDSVAALMRRVRQLACEQFGIITMSVRNGSQGWSRTETLLLPLA
jgi:hypothetical protein